MLAVYAIIHNTTDPKVWNETVRDYPWFASRSTLSSSPSSPTVEKGRGAPSLKHPRPKTAFDPSGLTMELSPFDDPTQPAPTSDRIPQPEQTPYECLHFAAMQDPPPVIDPAFIRPREAPRPPIKVQSLYPEHMQAQLSIEARNNLYGQSKQLESQEPSPIGDWPRNTRNNVTATEYSRRQLPSPSPQTNTDASASTRQPPSSSSSDQRSRLSGTTNVSSPVSPYKLGSPVRGPKRSSSTRKRPPPPLNLEGISNTSHHARR